MKDFAENGKIFTSERRFDRTVLADVKQKRKWMKGCHLFNLSITMIKNHCFFLPDRLHLIKRWKNSNNFVLIERGGGTGPVKPQQPAAIHDCCQGAKSSGFIRKIRRGLSLKSLLLRRLFYLKLFMNSVRKST